MTAVHSPPNRSTSRSHVGLPVVAMVGGGQLARMTHQAAIALGQRLRVLAASLDEPAAAVTPDVVLGSHQNLDDLRAVASGATVLTFDHEGVPTEHLHALVEQGVNVAPSPQALVHAQDKLVMRTRLAEMDLPMPAFVDLDTADPAATLREFLQAHPGGVVIKTTRGGYDGRGVWLPDTHDQAMTDLAEAMESGVPLMAEERVAMRRELSAMVARSSFGQGAAWPVVETVQRNGQCAVAIAPAPDLDSDVAEQAQQIALRLAAELDVVGVMAVELFQTADGAVSINELAMRPHNSGHWTIDGAVTSQFEQHIRAVLDYPLGDTRAYGPVTVMANVLGADEVSPTSMDERVHHLMARMPDAHIHLYAKGERPNRKIGHVNIVGGDGQDVEAVRERAERAATWLSTGMWTDGWDPHAEPNSSH